MPYYTPFGPQVVRGSEIRPVYQWSVLVYKEGMAGTPEKAEFVRQYPGLTVNEVCQMGRQHGVEVSVSYVGQVRRSDLMPLIDTQVKLPEPIPAKNKAEFIRQYPDLTADQVILLGSRLDPPMALTRRYIYLARHLVGQDSPRNRPDPNVIVPWGKERGWRVLKGEPVEPAEPDSYENQVAKWVKAAPSEYPVLREIIRLGTDRVQEILQGVSSFQD